MSSFGKLGIMGGMLALSNEETFWHNDQKIQLETEHLSNADTHKIELFNQLTMHMKRDSNWKFKWLCVMSKTSQMSFAWFCCNPVNSVTEAHLFGLHGEPASLTA